MMKLAPVESSAVLAVGYDRARHSLDVKYRSGAVYRYFEVPPRVHQELMTGASKGAYVNRIIKTRFRYRKLRRKTFGSGA